MHFLSMSALDSPGSSVSSQKHAIGQIGRDKFLLDMNECVNAWCSAMDWHPCQGVFGKRLQEVVLGSLYWYERGVIGA